MYILGKILFSQKSKLENTKIEIKFNKHEKKFICFCNDCLENVKANLCEECIVIHKNNYKNHHLTYFGNDDLLIKINKWWKF